MANKLICIVGISGVGKTAIRNKMLEKIPYLRYLPSFTTRTPRANEKEGLDYFYISKDDFIKMKDSNELLEWEEHFGEYYGISKSKCLELLSSGFSIIKEIAIGGLLQIQKLNNQEISLHSIYIYPDSIEDVIHRILERGSHDFTLRIQSASEELKHYALCDNIVVSKDGHFAEVCSEIEALIKNIHQ